MPESNLDRWAREVVEQSKGSIRSGLAITLVLHVLGQLVLGLIALAIPTGDGPSLTLLPLFFLGLSQLLYMIPAILLLLRRGDSETARGMIIGAGLTFLLNATCSGLFFFSW
jgi:hypothetical protein